MTLNEYIDALQVFITENPKYGEMRVVYSCDDEGNRFDNVYHYPTAGYFENDDVFIPECHFGEWDNTLEVNAICVN